MKLLEDLNKIIQESADRVKEINGFKVQLSSWDAVHYYYTSYDHGSRYSPPDYDTATKYIVVESLEFDLQNKNESYKVSYDFSKYAYNDFENEPDLIEQLKSDIVTIYDHEDDEVTDMKTVAHIKNIVSEYAYKSDIFDFLRDNAKQEEAEPDIGPDY